MSGDHRTYDTASLAAWSKLAVIAAMLSVLLVGCGGLSRSDRPAQVESRGAEPPPADTGRAPQIAAYTPPSSPRYARPAPKRAVEVLMAKANEQRRQGDLAGATVSLERALRIEPDDALLWHRLAGVRLDQRRFDLVAQLAAKSNSLADPADADLRRANWSITATAREALGDAGGARVAREQARRY